MRSLDELYSAAISGDTAAEKELFERLRERFYVFAVRRLVDKEAAEDLVQDALTMIAGEFRGLEVRVSFTAWAYKVIYNRLCSHVDRRKRRQGIVTATDLIELHPSTGEKPDLRLRIQHCFRALASKNRTFVRVLNLIQLGFSVEDICGRMSTTRSRIYVILHRARRFMKTCLEGNDRE